MTNLPNIANIANIGPGLKVGIIGLGIVGRAAVRFALGRGADVLISDNREPDRFQAEEQEILDLGVRWEAGGHSLSFLAVADLVLVSAGVPLNLPVFKELRDAGIPVAGELTIFAEEVVRQGLQSIPVIAVTGTNGKTTVTTLLGEIFKAAGKKVFVGGNIGTPLYDFLASPGDTELIVAELSSFQLASSGRFAPKVGILLNITPDHVDWHQNLEGYAAAKKLLFSHQDDSCYGILNGDDPLCRIEPVEDGPQLCYFGHGANESSCSASIAAYIRDLTNEVVLELESGKESYSLANTAFADGHGLANASAAILAARLMGCTRETVEKVLEGFEALPHRLQLVGECGGVRYYDDSKATNTGAVVAALGCLSTPVALIAGGRDKGDDYSLMADCIREKVCRLVLLGEAAPLIEKAVGHLTDTVHVTSMDEAVVAAGQAIGESGGTVLLSPACASFDMFRSYSHRGDVFQSAVRRLIAKQAGVQ